MTHHLGRLIDHVHLRVKDLDVSRRFYRAALDALELTNGWGERHDAFFVDELYVDRADDAGSGPVSRVHLAFQARSQEAVHRFYAAALAAGGRDHGAPGPRDYHPGYYGAFVLDPDGNNIEAVWHGPATRSAASVEIKES